MKDARKLDPTFEPQEQITVVPADAIEPRISEVELEPGLPPLPKKEEKTKVSHTAVTIDPKRRIFRNVEKASTLSLILFIGSLVGFATGVTLAVMLLTGTIDDSLNTIKDLLSF